MEKTGEAHGLRIQGGGRGKCFGPRAQLIFHPSKSRPVPRMPAQTQILADGSAQFHLAFILTGAYVACVGRSSSIASKRAARSCFWVSWSSLAPPMVR